MKISQVVVKVNTGADAIKRAPIVEENTGIKCLRIGDVSQKKKFSQWGFTKVTNDVYKNFQLKSGDIIIARTGNTIGVNSYIESELPAVFNNGLIRIKVDDKKVIPRYFYYIIQTEKFKNHINSICFGTSTQPNMQIDDLLLYETEIPSLRIQHEAVNILNLLDSKIALNNQMNETLESIAKAIFKEWFIDFGPVRAKSEGRRPFGMDDETAALFPDSFEDSELGPIPKGWKVELVENIFKLTIGRTPPRKESQWFSNSDNNIKWVSIKDMGNSSVYLSNTSEFLTQQAIEKFKIPIVHSNVVILSFKLTLGRISITTEPMVTNEAIAHFTPKENSFLKLPFYTYCYLSSFNYEKLGSTSSIATAINSTLLKSIKFLIPNVHILIRFNKLVESTFKQIKNNQLENNNLIKIQNLLLPKLISGEISLSNNDISTISNETTTHIPPIQQKIYAYTKNEGKINM